MSIPMPKENLNRHHDYDATKLKKLEEELERRNVDRNTFTVREFQKYAILFKKNPFDTISEESYMEIHNEFNERINPYRPIYIVETSYQQTGPNKGKRKVLFKLPPIWSEVSTINHLGEQAMAVNRWYANALNRFSPVSSERERATDAMRAVVKGMVDENRLKKDIIEYSKIMNKFEKITNKNNDESNKSLNDKRSAIIDEHVWEED